MAWWKRFFKKKTEPVEEDDWEQLVYTRNGVNFEEEDQRKRYIVNCLEQIAEASREIDLLTVPQVKYLRWNRNAVNIVRRKTG